MAQLIINKKGFSLIEILLAVTVFGMFSAGVFYLALDTIQRDAKIELDNTGLLYAREGLEAVKNMRDRNYFSITNGDHGLNFTNDTWTFIAAPEDIDSYYSRTIIVEDVYRDLSGNIAAEGTFDPDTKYITSRIDWNWRGIIPRSISLNTYISNWTGSDILQTTCSDFSAGTFDDTSVTVTTAPPNDNCALKLDLVEDQSDFFSSADIGDHGTDVVVSGNSAYVASNKTQTGLSVVDVTDKENLVVIENLDIGGKGRYVARSGNYTFIGVNKSDQGLAIANVSNLDIGNYGNDMDISGNYLYMGTESEYDSLKVIDISNINDPSIVASVDFDSKVRSVAIDGNYAYIGLSADRDTFQVLDISNPALPVKKTSLDLDEEVNAILINGIFAYVGIEQTSSSLRVVNISNPLSPSIVTSLDVGGEIQDLAVSGNYLYAAIDEQGAGLAAINISDPTGPVLTYNLDLGGKGTGIYADQNYVYITLDTNNKGLVVIGTTVNGVTSSGTYTSQKFDTGSVDARYNYISWDQLQVPGATVKLQIRTASTLGGLDSAIWVGSDGTGATFYDSPRLPIVLDPGTTGNQYFQFQIFIDSDGVNTPLIESLKVNFTP